jgi:hypothetical protein
VSTYDQRMINVLCLSFPLFLDAKYISMINVLRNVLKTYWERSQLESIKRRSIHTRRSLSIMSQPEQLGSIIQRRILFLNRLIDHRRERELRERNTLYTMGGGGGNLESWFRTIIGSILTGPGSHGNLNPSKMFSTFRSRSFQKKTPLSFGDFSRMC